MASSVIWPRNTSKMSRAAWSRFCNSLRWFSTYGTIISVTTLIESWVLLKCLGFELSENESGNSKFGRLFSVFPHKISCIRKNCPSRVTMKVPVILLLSDDLMIGTEDEVFFVIVWFIAGTHFNDIWPKLAGMSCFSTIETMSWRWSNSASFLAPSEIWTVPVVLILLLNPILQSKHCAQEESIFTRPRLYCGLRAIDALAVAMAIVLETTQLRLLNASKNLCTIWSKLPNNKGPLRGKELVLSIDLVYPSLLT